MPRTTLGQFITAVDLAIAELTDGVIGLDNLVDYADGEYSLSEMWVDELTPKKAAQKLLKAEGYELF